MARSVDNEWLSSSLLRPIGYVLLVLTLFDFIDILFPPKFMNPAWEFQTIGLLVERVAVPFVGLGLVFHRAGYVRSQSERFLLRFLSWAALLAGVLFLLLSPLLVVDGFRLRDQINDQISIQVSQQVSQLENLENKVNQGTAQDINDAVNYINQVRPNSLNIKNPEQAKSTLLSEINKVRATIRPQAKAAWADRRLALIKNTFKWLLGAVISGVLFIYIWGVTKSLK